MSGVRRCRLCGSEESFDIFLNIDETYESELVLRIKKLLPFVVMTHEVTVPNLLCQECITKVNMYDHFYEATKKAELLRTQDLSVPGQDLGNLDPVAEEVVTEGSLSKLPPKKRVDRNANKNLAPELKSTEVQEHTVAVQKPTPLKVKTKKIIIENNTFRCRNCSKTFRRESSALMHACLRLEECVVPETLGMDENDAAGTSLPPLKLRFFSFDFGKYKCSICRASFKDRTEVMQHIRVHLYNSRKAEPDVETEAETETEADTQSKQRQRKGRRGSQESEDVDWRKTYYKSKRKQKKEKTPATPRKARRRMNVEEELPQLERPEDCEKPEEGDLDTESVKPQAETVPSVQNIEMSTQTETILDPPWERNTLPTTLNVPEEKGSDAKVGEISSINEDDKGEKGPGVSEEDSLSIMEGVEEEQGPSGSGLLSVPREAEPPPEDNRLDEVTVLEVVPNRTSVIYLACIFCDRIFSSREALIAHQNRHVKEDLRKKASDDHPEREEKNYVCRLCQKTLSNKNTMLEHERFHQMESRRKPSTGMPRDSPASYQGTERHQRHHGDIIMITEDSSDTEIQEIDML